MSLLFDLLYLGVLTLLSPFLLFRSLRTGRYRQGLKAKTLGSTPTVSQQPLIWFHGVSVGEVHLLRQVVAGFRERHPNWQVVISSTTDTGLAEARKHFAELIVIPFPFDFSWAVRRTIRHLRPRLIVLAESEMWPNFLRAANRFEVPIVVINGRMSPRSARRYSRISSLVRPLLFNRVRLFAMQTQSYADNLLRVGVEPEKVKVTGSVKYDGVLATRDHPKTRELATLFGFDGTETIWVAGSTHSSEEEIALQIYAGLKERYPSLRLILVPRSPDRFNEVASLIEKRGLRCYRRSQPQDLALSQAVILVDTMGELGATWGLATIGFTGGSLNDQRGGQSMIEPAGLGIPVLIGPHTWNFRDAVNGLKEVNGIVVVANAAELERELVDLLDNPAKRQRIGAAAQEFVFAQQGATDRTLNLIDKVIFSSTTPQKR
jgi:3-deoxy-D-manno-octulosonic-acid transferase